MLGGFGIKWYESDMSHIRVLIIAAVALASCSQLAAEYESDAYWQALPSADQATVVSIALGVGESLLSGTEAGLFVSVDLGESWHLRSPVDWHISAILSTSGEAILVGTYREGIKRTLDGGRSWTTVGFENNVYVDALIEDNDGRIFAAVAYSLNNEPTGIFRSDDDGETWVQTGPIGEDAFSVSTPLPGHLYSGTDNGTFRSVDGGSTWTQIEALSFPAPLSQVIAHRNTLFASFAEPRYRAPGGGVMRSSDSGTTWAPMDGLPAETSIHALAVVGDTVIAIGGDVRGRGGRGIYRSVDHKRWEQLGLQDYWLKSMVKNKEGALFVGAIEAGVFVSGPGDTDWSLKNTGLRNWSLTALAFDASDRLNGVSLRSIFRYDEPGTAWTSHDLPEHTADVTPANFTSLPDGTMAISGMGGMLLSKDASGPWSWSGFPANESAIDVHVAGDEHIFATLFNGKVFVTDGTNETWSQVDVPERTRGMLLSPAGTLFAFGDGVYRQEAEKGWVQVIAEQNRVLTVKACGRTLYSGGLRHGVFSSRDDGRTWEPVTEELRETAQQKGYIAVHSLLCLPNKDLLAATFSDGIFIRVKDGAWKDVSAGLPSRSTGDLVLGPDGKVYVATTSGVYSSSELSQ